MLVPLAATAGYRSAASERMLVPISVFGAIWFGVCYCW
jgi:hypothetical protein